MVKESWLDTTESRKVTPTLDEIETVGGWAFAHGRFTAILTWRTGKSQDMSGHFLNVFKRESDTRWRYKKFSFNFDKPFVPVQ
jgi:ketosteroid isomerase-like protein